MIRSPDCGGGVSVSPARLARDRRIVSRTGSDPNQPTYVGPETALAAVSRILISAWGGLGVAVSQSWVFARLIVIGCATLVIHALPRKRWRFYHSNDNDPRRRKRRAF